MANETAAPLPSSSGDDLPVLTRPAAAPAGQRPAELVSQLRRWHFSPPAESALEDHFLPALLHGSARRDASSFPLFLNPPEGDEAAFHLSLTDLLSRALPAGETNAWRDRLPALEGHVRRLAADRQAPVEARDLLAAAGRALVEGDAAAGEPAAGEPAAGEPAAGEALEAGLDGLLAGVPAGGQLLAFSEQAPLHLLMHAARCRLRPARAAFREEARALEERAATLLEVDRSKRSGERPQAGGAMGALGSRFIDPASLTSVLERQSAGTAMPAARREGLEQAFATLELLTEAHHPELILVHDGGADGHGLDPLRKDGDWQIVEHRNPCAAAAELFDQEAEKLAGVLRAVRRIALEAAGDYRPELHDPWLEQFDWQAFSRHELLLLPPVVAVVSADRVAGEAMVALSRLLLSGRPVQVLVLVQPLLNPGAADGDPLAGYRFEPAYLGLSHREALVQQTSLARPAHMLQGFFRALAATHAGLHVISTATAETALDAEATAAAALDSRAHPVFRFDPEAGGTWAERFDFAHNPQPEDDWSTGELAARREGGGEETLQLAFTFADLALSAPVYARHFHPVPDGVPETALTPVADYCAADADAESGIPFVWAVDGESRLARLAVSRPLALACRDRLDFWRTLQELAGVRSEYARRAAERARAEAEAKAHEERVRLETLHAEELERLRRDAARDVVDRLTAALLEVDVSSLAGPAPAPPSLAAFSGRGVDEVAAALLELADPATLDRDDGAGDERAGDLAAELQRLVEAD